MILKLENSMKRKNYWLMSFMNTDVKLVHIILANWIQPGSNWIILRMKELFTLRNLQM